MIYRFNKKHKSTFILVLIALLLVSLSSLMISALTRAGTVRAEGVEAALTYDLLDDGTYTVKSIDAANESNIANKTNLAIVIPATYNSKKVTKISNIAFAANSNTGYTFTSLDMSKATNLTSIGNFAFSGCNGFTGTLTLPSSLTTIGNSAFEKCSGFTGTLTLPSSLTSIGASAFASCSGFTGTLNLPSSLTSIEPSAFSDCSRFTALTLPNNLTSIGASAFSDCSGFTGTLNLPSSLTAIGNSAFYGCTNLQTIYLTAAKTTGGTNIIYGTNVFFGITCLMVAPDKTAYDAFITSGHNLATYNKYLTYALTVTFNAGDGGTVDGSQTLTQEKLFNRSLSFEKDELGVWAASTDYTLPLATRNGYAFIKWLNGTAEVTKNTTVTDPATYTAEWGYRITFNGNGNGVTGTMEGQIVAQGSAINLTKNAFARDGYTFDGWSTSSGGSATYTDGQSVEFTSSTTLFAVWTEIKSAVLTYTKNADNTTFSVSGIDKNDTYNTDNKSNLAIVIPATYQGQSVTGISANAFMASRNSEFNFTSLDMSKAANLTTIGNSAFEKCSGFTGTLTLPSSLTTIGNSAFEKCSGFTGTLTLPSSLTSIGVSAFASCSGFTGTLTLPSSLESLGNSAFWNCTNLQTIYLTAAKTTGGTNITYGTNVFFGITCPMVAPDKTAYDAFITSGHNLATYNKYLTYALTVTFNAGDGGTVDGSQTLTQEKLFNRSLSFEKDELGVWAASTDYTLPLATRNGYAFIKWLNGTAEVKKDTKVTDLATYTAEWGFIITFNGNGNGVTGTMAEQIAAQGSTINLTKNTFALDGYIFDGWSTSSGGSATYTDGQSVTFTSSATLYAVWKKIESAVLTFTQNANSTTWSVSGIDKEHNYNLSNKTNLSIVIPATYQEQPVTGISASAFSANNANNNGFIFTSLNMSSATNLTSIGNTAFASCSGFTGTLTLPSSLTSIGNTAFASCSGFTGTLTLPSSLTSIGQSAFENCTGFTALTLPSSLESIGNSAFSGCSGFTGALTLPNSITSIGQSAFSGCSGFTGSLTLPSSLTSIGDYAFQGCSNLQTIYLTAAKTTGGTNITYGTSVFSGITCLMVAPDKTAYDAFITSGHNLATYNKYLTYALTVTFNAGDGGTVDGSQTLTQEKLLNRLLSFEKNEQTGVWAENSNYTLPNATRVGYGFIKWLNGTAEVKKDTKVTDLATYTAEWGYRITFNGNGATGTMAEQIAAQGSAINLTKNAFARDGYFFDGWSTSSGGTGTTYFDEQSVTFTSSATLFAVWKKATSAVLTFTQNTNSTTFSVAGIDKEHNYNIANKTNLSIVIPATYQEQPVTGISNSAFSVNNFNNSGFTFTSLDMSKATNLTSIGASAFSGCSGFTALTLPNSLTSIGASAFLGCSKLSGTLTIPNSVSTVGDSAFFGCSGFTGTLTLPSSLDSIGASAFRNCSGFTGTLDLPSSLTSIGDYAFFGCSGFTGTLTLPSSLTSIGNSAFSGCSGFTALTLPSNLKSIGNYAFYGCTKFTGTLTLPSSLESIGNSAFFVCSNLKTIYLTAAKTAGGANITYGTNVFSGITCLMVAPDKTAYDAFITSGHNLAVYNTSLTYALTVTFNAGDGGTVDGSQTLTQEKLFNQLFSFEKNELGVWAKNTNYTLPLATRDGCTFIKWLNGTAGVTKDTLVTSTTYTVGWKLNDPIISNLMDYSGIYDGISHNISIAASHKATVTFTYQWYKYDGNSQVLLEGETAATLSLKNVIESGAYVCVVTATYEELTASATSDSITVSITPLAITLGWAGIDDLVYNGQAKTPSASAQNIISGDICNVTIGLTPGCDNINVGTFSFTALSIDNKNYKLPENVTSGNYVITPKSVAAAWKVADGYIYTGNSQLDSITATINGVGTDGEITLDVAVSSGGTSFKNAGTYSFLATYPNSNYLVTNTTLTGVVIEKAQVAQPTLTNDRVYNGEMQFPNIPTNPLYTISGEGKNAGEGYTSTVTLADAANYKWIGGENSPLTYTWKISKAEIAQPTLTNDRVYNGKEQFPNIPTNPLYTISGEGKNAGEGYTSTVTLADAANYKWIGGENSPLTYTWKISKAQLTISADDKDVTYGDELTAYTASFDGLVGGDTFEDLIGNISFACIYQPGSKAGTYTISPSGYTSENYIITYADGTLTVQKATLDMSGVTFSDITLVEDDDSHTIVISGTLPDGVTVTYSGTGGYDISGVRKAGIYTVTATFTLADSDNFNMPESMTATLTINVSKITGETVDGETNVIIGGANGIKPGTTVELEEKPADDYKESNIVFAGGKQTVLQATDIKMMSNGAITQPDGSVTVRLLIKQSLRGYSELLVFHIAPDGTTTNMNAVRDGDYMVFDTTHFSVYAIVTPTIFATPTGLSGGAIAGIVIASIFVILILLLLAMFFFRKDKELDFKAYYVGLGSTCASTVKGWFNKGSDEDFDEDDFNGDMDEDELNEILSLDFKYDKDETGDDDSVDNTTAEDSLSKDIPNAVTDPPIQKNKFIFGTTIYRKSLLAKLCLGSEENKAYYTSIKNMILSYQKVRSTVSFAADTFTLGRKRMAKIVIAGKTLKLYLALSANELEKKYNGHDASTVKKHEKTPVFVRVKSEKGLDKALALVEKLFADEVVEKNPNYIPTDFSAIYTDQSRETLIANGLIKVTKNKN